MSRPAASSLAAKFGLKQKGELAAAQDEIAELKAQLAAQLAAKQ